MSKKEELEAKLEELESDIDLLCRQQNDVLGYGGDDLWIREQIAELEDIAKEVRSELYEQT